MLKPWPVWPPQLRGETKFGIIPVVMLRRGFASVGRRSVGRRASVRRGRSRVGAFAHDSNTPPPRLLAKPQESI